MQAAADLDLPYLAMEDPAFAEDPFRHVEAARKRHPWLAKSAFGYVVSEYEAMKELLTHDEKMATGNDGVIAALGAEGTPFGRFIQEQILAQSGAAHKRLRDIVAPMFTPRNANLHRPLMRETIARLLDEWAPKGAFDFEVFASHFPIRVMCRLIGASPDVVPSLRESLEALGLAFSMDKAHVPGFQRGITVLDDFVHRLIAERRAGARLGPERDILDMLLEASGGEQGLSERETADMLLFLFIAGYDTSKNMLTLVMRRLLDHPEAYARCAEDPAWCAKVVEEGFRIASTANIPRLVTEEIVYRDVSIPPGVMLFFPVCVAGRDPAVAPDAEAFRPERDQIKPHIAFGRGAHICLGRYIARAQIEEGLHLIAQRLANPKLAGAYGYRPFFGVWGLKGLPVAFEPRPARSPAQAAS